MPHVLSLSLARTKGIEAAHAEATLTAGLRHLDRVREVWLVRCVLFAEFLGACLIPARIFSPFLRKAAGNLKGHTRACALRAAERANTLPAAALLPPAPSAAAARSAKTKTLRSLRAILGKGDRVGARSLARVFVSSEHEAASSRTGHQNPYGLSSPG